MREMGQSVKRGKRGVKWMEWNVCENQNGGQAGQETNGRDDGQR